MKKKIVIFRNGSYGDGLVAIPCLKLIKLNNMQSDIHYLNMGCSAFNGFQDVWSKIQSIHE